jgi:DNA (cytosine-5)-methyltransferase 1
MPSRKTKERNTLEDARTVLEKRPQVVELFTGVGGMSYGLEQAGFFVPIAVEIEEIAGRYAQYNAPSTRVLYGDAEGDVRHFGRDVLRKLAPRLGDIAVVAGGPPCQGFSMAGKKNDEDPLNDLVLEFARVVLELKPLAFLMENVPGITLGSSSHLAEAIKRLKKAYRVTEPTPKWACDFGVPQARQRVFVLGIRRDVGTEPSFPDPTFRRPSAKQLALDLSPTTPTVWEAISDIPSVDEYPELIDGDRVPYTRSPESAYQRSMRAASAIAGLAPGVAWDPRMCTNLRRTQHGSDMMIRFERLGFAQADKLSGIRRLDPADVATTIRAGTTKDRGAWSAPRPLHPYQHRVLTTRECARIQSFPDWFFFHPTKWHGNRQVGNAVPPLLARAIGEHVLKLLGISAKADDVPVLERNETLVAQDIIDARDSGLSTRKISQQVVHPRRSQPHEAA